MTKKYFNLIEVTLAMGISVIALIMLTGMLPVGISNSRDAVSIDVSSNLLNGFSDVLIDTTDYAVMENWAEPIFATVADEPDISEYIDTTSDLSSQNSSAYFDSTAFGNNIFVNSSSRANKDQLFFLSLPIYDADGNESKFREVETEIRIWSTTPQVFSSTGGTGSHLGFSSRSTGRGGSRLDQADLKTLIVEASWPISKEYSKRTKLRIVRDITKP